MTALPDGSDVLAVVVGHASRTRLREALRSLGGQSHRSLDIVVGAVGPLEVPDDDEVPPHRVVRVPEEAGFAGAVRAAVDESPRSSYVLLCHDDVSLDPEAIAELVRTAEADPTIAAVGAKLLEWDRPEVLQEVGASIDRFAIRRTALDVGEVDAGQRDDTTDVLFCSDACLLVSREAFDDIAGLDPRAWPFYEDVDLCWRLRVRGLRVVVAPGAHARHAADLSSGRRLFDAIALREHAERGRLRFMLKHYAPIGIAVLLPQLIVASMARLLAAVVRRELWRARVIFNSWRRVLLELPSLIAARRRAGPAHVDDRELLSLAGRSAVAGVRGERAEWASRVLENVGRAGERSLALARLPVTWAWVAAGIVVIVVLRDVLFSGPFALGEIRPTPTLGDAIAGHLGRVRPEGLDPFGPAAPGLLLVSIVRSVVRSAAFAEKLLLLIPLWLAGASGARLGRTLGFGPDGRGWLAVVAAVNPVTLTLLRDGSMGATVFWAGALWVVATMLAPVPPDEGLSSLVRYHARWGFGWAVVVALHPPSFFWLAGVGAVIVAARRDDDRTDDRLRILIAGSGGAFVLLMPWSLEWLTLRSPIVGRPGWLLASSGGGLEKASLGGGWPFLVWLGVAAAAGFFVGQTRTTFGLTVLGGTAVIASATGAFPRETMLAAAGVCALVVVAIIARRIIQDLPGYELGRRQAAVIGGVAVLGALWLGGVVENAAPGARNRALPVATAPRADTGRVLWLSETTGGLRSSTTLGFSHRLGAFPTPGGPAEHLASRAVDAGRDGRTHRTGGVLALADISHVVALDGASSRGLDSQSDLAQLEVQGGAVVYRNEAWRGPALRLPSPPGNALSPAGLADVVRDPRPVRIRGWPAGRIVVDPEPMRGDAESSAVLYIAGGPRGGLGIEGGRGRLAAAGAYIPALGLDEPMLIEPPGTWWRWMLQVQLALVAALLVAWIVSAYVGNPAMVPPDVAPESGPITLPSWLPSWVVTGAGAWAVLGVALGWSGIAWGVGGSFLSSAWYCPPIGQGFNQAIGIVNPGSDDVEYLVRPDLSSKPKAQGPIRAGTRKSLEVSSGDGAVVESYGGRLAVAAQVERFGDRDASLCTQSTRESNVFPEGGRFATRAQPRLFERYILYNPFPDLARASVRFLSPERPISPPDLRDVRVDPGSFTVVDPEREFEPMLDLSTVVTVWQGRAIVARRLRTVEQVSWSLPTEMSQSGVLPRAQTLEAETEITAVNLAEDPARVSVFGAGRRGSIREADFAVPAVGRGKFSLNTIAPRASDLVVELEADRPVALESLVAPSTRSTVSLMPPLSPERRWVFPIAERRALYLMNPNTTRVRVTIERLGPGPPIEEVSIDPSRMARVPLQGRGTFGVLVRSSGGGITAAVIGQSGSMAGVPLS